MIRVGIIGATGYAGAELVRILVNHPAAEIAAVGSVSFQGKKLSDVYPSFASFCDLELVSTQTVIDSSDVVFACVQHGLSQEFAAQCREKNVKFIDLGADFRLEDEADYKEWYGLSYTHRELHNEAVYGLPELFRDAIKERSVIANPGCYPTSIALGLAPALSAGLVETNGIVIDSKSGVTGAGRGLTDNTHFPMCNEAFAPYKIAQHRHTPEIEQTLSRLAGETLKVLFVPHLLPVNRGIISTIYAPLRKDVTQAEVRAAYESFYREEPFVRLKPAGEVANLKHVRGSNYCDISLHMDTRTNTLVIVSAIDNMVKGAAGQAVQNMNILFGQPEDAGLNLVPAAF